MKSSKCRVRCFEAVDQCSNQSCGTSALLQRAIRKQMERHSVVQDIHNSQLGAALQLYQVEGFKVDTPRQ
eukprot:2098855-Amphidinium_carterae.1